MDESFIGAIVKMAFNWAPQCWMPCHGQVLAVAQNQALFALIGTLYGGNGINTFNLPDLRVKDENGNYYQTGQIMKDGTPYIESYICVQGIFPSRQ